MTDTEATLRGMVSSLTDLVIKREADNERLLAALIKIRSVVGTSTEAWHIANRAVETKP